MAAIACVHIMVLGSAATAEPEPPSSVDCYRQLDRLYRAGRFNEIDEYVRTLQSHEGYVPARVAEATWLYRQGSQVEDFLEESRSLRDDLKDFPQHVSPSFKAALESAINRYEDLANWYSEKALGKAARKERFDPRRMPAEKRSRSWGFEQLFATAPEICVDQSDRVTDHWSVGDLRIGVPTSRLARQLLDSSVAPAERVNVAAALGDHGDHAALPALVKALEAPEWTVVTAAARALGQLGEAALPALVEILQTPDAHSGSVVEHAVWALIRIDVETPEVKGVLEGLGGHRVHGEYATVALAFLTRAR